MELQRARLASRGEIELKAKTIGASLEEEAAVVSATPQPPKAEEKKAATPAPAAPQDGKWRFPEALLLVALGVAHFLDGDTLAFTRVEESVFELSCVP